MTGPVTRWPRSDGAAQLSGALVRWIFREGRLLPLKTLVRAIMVRWSVASFTEAMRRVARRRASRR
ncbi:hypothetical protein, partial [Camelimonas fluminis]